MKHSKLLFLGLALVLMGSFVASSIQSVNGTVKVIDIVIAAKNGVRLSALMFVPPNATKESPAPAVIDCHGYVNQKEVMSNFNIEFARRGYVVIALDESGHGGTQVIDNDGSRGVDDMIKYVHTLPFVDKKNVGLVGHSMGGWSAVSGAVMNKDLVRTVIVVGSAQGGHKANFMLGAPWLPEDATFNFGVEFGKYDEFVAINYFDQKRAVDFVKSDWLMGPFNTKEPVVLDKVYGDFFAGTGRMATQAPETHAGAHQSKIAIANVTKIMNLSSPAPVKLEPMDQIWPYKEMATSVAYIGLVMFMLGVAASLFKTSFFSGMVQSLKTNKPMNVFVYTVLVALIIASVAYTLIPVQMTTMLKFGAGKIFPLLFANTSIAFFGLIQVVFLLLFIVWHVVAGRKNGESAISYGLSTSTSYSEFAWAYIGKAFLFSLISVGCGYSLVATVYGLFNVDARWWMLLIRPMEPHRLATAFAYVIPYFVIFFINGLLAFGWLRLRDFGSELKNTLIWTLAVFFVNSAGVMIVIAIQMASLYITGQPRFAVAGYDTLMVILGNGFIPLFAITSIMSTYCFRKTGNIYTGTFVSTLLTTWMVVCYQPY